jgi:acetolactate synthase small subunit
MVENPLITELNLGESLIEIKKAAFIFENSGDPDVLDELLKLIKNLDIPVLISELHIPYEAEA